MEARRYRLDALDAALADADADAEEAAAPRPPPVRVAKALALLRDAARRRDDGARGEAVKADPPPDVDAALSALFLDPNAPPPPVFAGPRPLDRARARPQPRRRRCDDEAATPPASEVEVEVETPRPSPTAAVAPPRGIRLFAMPALACCSRGIATTRPH